MSAELAHEGQRSAGDEVARAVTWRARVVLALGPAVSLAGIAWAFLQPWRVTLLSPGGQSFWWLVSEPPLYVVLVGLLFRLVVVPGLLDDLEETEG
jgi:hypothetical protein